LSAAGVWIPARAEVAPLQQPFSASRGYRQFRVRRNRFAGIADVDVELKLPTSRTGDKRPVASSEHPLEGNICGSQANGNSRDLDRYGLLRGHGESICHNHETRDEPIRGLKGSAPNGELRDCRDRMEAINSGELRAHPFVQAQKVGWLHLATRQRHRLENLLEAKCRLLILLFRRNAAAFARILADRVPVLSRHLRFVVATGTRIRRAPANIFRLRNAPLCERTTGWGS
jgi:hypothetical protein